MRTRECFVIPALLVMWAFTTACPNTVSTASVPPPPAPAMVSKPDIEFFQIAKDQPSALTWSVRNAAHIQIDQGIGEVAATGLKNVHPGATTTYKLEATNSAGTTTAVFTVTTGADEAASTRSLQSPAGASSAEMLSTQLEDLHFNYNEDELLETDKPILEKDTQLLKALFATDPNIVIVIEGHCDERGSSEYNVALGVKRANFVKDVVVRAGLAEGQINVVSYGKEQPACLEPTDECLARNRRVHFAPSR